MGETAQTEQAPPRIVTFKMSAADYEALAEAAAADHRTVSAVIRLALANYPCRSCGSKGIAA